MALRRRRDHGGRVGWKRKTAMSRTLKRVKCVVVGSTSGGGLVEGEDRVWRALYGIGRSGWQGGGCRPWPVPRSWLWDESEEASKTSRTAHVNLPRVRRDEAGDVKVLPHFIYFTSTKTCAPLLVRVTFSINSSRDVGKGAMF